MKIALLTPTFCRFSGIDRVVEQQAKELSQQGNSITIFALDADMKPPENVELRLLGMPRRLFWQRVYRLVFPLDFPKAIRWVPQLKGFEIVYSHSYPMNWLACLAKRFYGVEFVYYHYGIPGPKVFPGLAGRMYQRIFIALANRTARRADSAISISHYLQRQLKQETGLDSKVVYNSIDIERFHPGLDGSNIRNRYGLGQGPIIVYVGRISPYKGVHLLIQAFGLVRQEIPNAKLLIVGKHTFPDYSRKLREMADDSVIFAGYVSDEELPYYYAACDLYATATLWEGFNLPLAEAQACGKPVVAFNLGPHPEVVSDGETGLLVPPRDTDALAEAVIKLLKDTGLRQEMGEKACELVRSRFS